MLASDAIVSTLHTSMMVLNSYVSDLTDAELLTRPATGCKHLAWQLGHLIESSNSLLSACRPGAGIELPAGFAEQHSKATADQAGAEGFHSKETYLKLFEAVNAAVIKAVQATSADEFDQPGPAFLAPMFPTVGSVYILIATHPMMHAGQFVPVRRTLGKPVVI